MNYTRDVFQREFKAEHRGELIPLPVERTPAQWRKLGLLIFLVSLLCLLLLLGIGRAEPKPTPQAAPTTTITILVGGPFAQCCTVFLNGNLCWPVAKDGTCHTADMPKVPCR